MPIQNTVSLVIVTFLFFSISVHSAAKPPAVMADTHPADRLLAEATQAARARRYAEADALLRAFLADYPDSPQRASALSLLQDNAILLITSPLSTPQTVLYTVAAGDSLKKIATAFNTTVALLKKSNRIDGSLIHPGQSIRVWAVPFRIQISIRRNELELYAGEQFIKRYPVATGENNSTPAGTFTISSKMIDPVWYNRRKGEVIAGGDPLNALGTRWLGLNLPQFGIHGTLRPDLIGQPVSHGCIRMKNADVEELFDLIPMGTTVVVCD